MSVEEKSEMVSTADHEATPGTSRPPSQAGIVDFEGPDDPYNAQNWPMKKKFVVTMLYSIVTMSATFASTMLVFSMRCLWCIWI
jgi:hypothetical protein